MRDKVDELLKQTGAVLIRHKKHEIWKLPNGQNFVRAQTPSDKKADTNSLSDLKNLLGLNDERGREGVRREKKTSNGRTETFHYERSINTGLADKLRLTGTVENSLRERISILENQNKLLIEESSEICWFCNLKSKLRKWLK